MTEIKRSIWAIKNMVFVRSVELLWKTIYKKWIPIFNGTGVDDSIRNCHLCEEFYVNGCNYCPVLRKTRQRECCGTPFDHWDSHHEKKHPKKETNKFPRKIECPECKKIALEVINFAEVLHEDCIERGNNGRN